MFENMFRSGRALRRAPREAADPTPGRHLLVASTGGHLAQLVKWSALVGSDADSLFVTFESPQSHSLLGGRRVLYVPYVAPRSVLRTGGAFSSVMREIDWRGENFAAAISTGAAVGVAGLAAARLHGVPSYFFESVSRVNGPSLTGKLVGLDRGIHRYCQYEYSARSRWTSRQSLFDSFAAIPKPPVERPRLFVTLGTIQPYRFDALVDAVLATGLADENTVWQLGVTDRHDLPGRAVAQMDGDAFDNCARAADVVITHSGVGTIMRLLEMGVHPVVVPRRVSRHEHVDDHQTQIANLIRSRGISVVSEAGQLERSDIISASAAQITSMGNLLESAAEVVATGRALESAAEVAVAGHALEVA